MTELSNRHLRRIEMLRFEGKSAAAARKIVEREAEIAGVIMQQTPDGIPAFYSQTYARGLRFKCPACGKVNFHSPVGGYRVSHCSCWPNGYVLAEPSRERAAEDAVATKAKTPGAADRRRSTQ